jgi:hypothetical protein
MEVLINVHDSRTIIVLPYRRRQQTPQNRWYQSVYRYMLLRIVNDRNTRLCYFTSVTIFPVGVFFHATTVLLL